LIEFESKADVNTAGDARLQQEQKSTHDALNEFFPEEHNEVPESSKATEVCYRPFC